MQRKIIKKGNSVLVKVAEDIDISKLNSSDIQALIQDLKDTLEGESQGVGLASPQIGVSKRVFVICASLYDEKKYSKINHETVFINPRIIKSSKDSKKMEEGCLSIPQIIGFVKRPSRITIEAYNEFGDKFKIEASGTLARVCLHENDHLDGILFDTKATNLREIEYEKL